MGFNIDVDEGEFIYTFLAMLRECVVSLFLVFLFFLLPEPVFFLARGATCVFFLA